ncbi:MAG: hypothetical protein AAFW68_08990 [Pseudomonadota bacterium]
MNRLRSLGALVAGAIVLAAIYGVVYSNGSGSAGIAAEHGDGVRHIVSGDRGEFSLRLEDFEITANWRGDYELNSDGDDIASLERKLDIKREKNGVKERVVFDRDGDDVERIYYLDGEEQESGPETQEAIQSVLASFLGASGVKAEERVAILLRNGGPAEVINLIDEVYGDHARQRYTAELTEQADLSTEELSALLEIVKQIEGDHDLRLALSAIVENETIRADQAPLILEAANRIESDYDLRRLIESVADHPLGADALPLAIGLLTHIDSDHDLRRSGEALLEQENLTAENAAQLLETVSNKIESDHDLRLLLSEAGAFLGQDEVSSAAWIRAFGALDSDHDKRIVLAEVAELDDISTDVVIALINATTDIESNHDRRIALESFANRARAEARLRMAYEMSARAMNSQSDRERALAAIGADD